MPNVASSRHPERLSEARQRASRSQPRGASDTRVCKSSVLEDSVKNVHMSGIKTRLLMRHDRHKNDGSTTSSRKSALQQHNRFLPDHFCENPHLAFAARQRDFCVSSSRDSPVQQHKHSAGYFAQNPHCTPEPFLRFAPHAARPAASLHHHSPRAVCHLSTQQKRFLEALIRYECQSYTSCSSRRS